MESNVKKVREALLAIKSVAEREMRHHVSMSESDNTSIRAWSNLFVSLASQALTAPPRNCDVMDWRTAWAKWRTENHPQKPVGYSECYESSTMFMDWYTGTAEREG
jgi:hypothetical protein